MKRKVSLRDGFLRKLKAEGTRIVWKRNGVTKRKRPIKKQSRSLRTRTRAYYALTEAFLKRDENRFCIICTVRREHGENILVHLATEVHHYAGRIGRLLCYVPYFRASCYECRDWPHKHPKLARELGLLSPAALWNSFPSDTASGNGERRTESPRDMGAS